MLRNTRLLQIIFTKALRDRRRTIALSWKAVKHISHINHNNIVSYASWRYFTTLTFKYRALCTKKVSELSCWKCNHSYPDNIHGATQFFCPSCEIIQEPQEDRTYFDILGCEESFDVDTKHLTNIFRKLQSYLHPDKFSLKSETEQLYSSLQSSFVNEAYQILLKPLSRGLYLLKIHNSSIEEGKTGNDIEFLSDIMEMNEALENGSETTLNELQIQIKKKLESCIQNISDAFQNHNIEAAKEILSKMKYYDNINGQIKEKMMEWQGV